MKISFLLILSLTFLFGRGNANDSEIPVEFKDGEAGADSIWRNDHAAMMAFVEQTTGKFPWANAESTTLPQTVWYKFSKPIKVVKFAFSSRIDGNLWQSPTIFEFVGSHDCQTWSPIVKIKTKFTKLNQEKSWTVATDQAQSFECYGFKIFTVDWGHITAIQKAKFWRLPDVVPVEFKDGQAGADSIWRHDHEAMNAFVPQTSGKYPWANEAGTQLPQTVWYKFKDPIKVAIFGFSSRIEGPGQAPTDFEFVGSNNDDCSGWVTIEKIQTKFTAANQAKTWSIPLGKAHSYRCYGFKVNESPSHPIASIQNAKMWKIE